METIGLTNTQALARPYQRPGAELASPLAGASQQDVQLRQAVRSIEETQASSPSYSDVSSKKDTLFPSNDLYTSLEPAPIPEELSAAERSAAYAQLYNTSGSTMDQGEVARLFLKAQNLFAEA